MITFENLKLKLTSSITGFKVGCFDLEEIETCPFADECKNFCYAKRASKRFDKVKTKRQKNLQESLSFYFEVNMITNIINSQAHFIRIHSSGDFYSLRYLKRWIKIIEALPHVEFYAYSKSIPFFKKVKLPKNFTVIYSHGGKKDNMIKPTDRQAMVIDKKEDIKRGFTLMGDNDLLYRSVKKIAIIKH